MLLCLCRIAARMQLYRRLHYAVGAQRDGHHCLCALFRCALHPQAPAHAAAALAAEQQAQLCAAQKAAPVLQPCILACFRQAAAIIHHRQLPEAFAAAQHQPHFAARTAGPQGIREQMQAQQFGIIAVRHDPAGCPAAIVQRQAPPRSCACTISACAATCCTSSAHRSMRVKTGQFFARSIPQQPVITSFDGAVQPCLALAALMSVHRLPGLAGRHPRAGKVLVQVFAVVSDEGQRMKARLLHSLLRHGLDRQLGGFILQHLLHSVAPLRLPVTALSAAAAGS